MTEIMAMEEDVVDVEVKLKRFFSNFSSSFQVVEAVQYTMVVEVKAMWVEALELGAMMEVEAVVVGVVVEEVVNF